MILGLGRIALMINGPGSCASWPPERRWLAGLLWADGHLAEDRRVHLNLVDEQTLAAAAALVGRSYGTSPGKKRPGGGRYSPLHRLTFTDDEFVSALVSLGFGPKPLRPWPSALTSGAFLRGMFDGDGSVRWVLARNECTPHLRTVLSCQVPVLEGCQGWLTGRGFRPGCIVPRPHSPGSGQLQWAHYDSLRLAKLMYAEPGPYMTRKRAAFEQVSP